MHITLRGVIGKLPRALARPITLVLPALSKYRQVFDNLPGVVARALAGQPLAEAGVAAPAAA